MSPGLRLVSGQTDLPDYAPPSKKLAPFGHEPGHRRSRRKRDPRGPPVTLDLPHPSGYTDGVPPEPEKSSEKTAAVLLIGNELLSGKTADQNAHSLRSHHQD